MYEIRLTTQAKRAYTNLDNKTKTRVNQAFDSLEAGNFQQSNIISLQGPLSHLLRYRLGNWRILFQVKHNEKTIIVESITKRGGAYR